MPTSQLKSPRLSLSGRALKQGVGQFTFPCESIKLERYIRFCLGLDVKIKQGGQTPTCYQYDEVNDIYIANQEAFQHLLMARRYLGASSYREVAAWLRVKFKALGLPEDITEGSLHLIMKYRPPYDEIELPKEEREELIESITKWNEWRNQEIKPLQEL